MSGRPRKNKLNYSLRKNKLDKSESNLVQGLDLDEDNLDRLCSQLSDAMAAKHLRVIDIFREWDDDNNGLVSKAEFRKAMPMLGLDVTLKKLDTLFDSWDKDGSGVIELKELNQLLRQKHAGGDYFHARPQSSPPRRRVFASGHVDDFDSSITMAEASRWLVADELRQRGDEVRSRTQQGKQVIQQKEDELLQEQRRKVNERRSQQSAVAQRTAELKKARREAAAELSAQLEMLRVEDMQKKEAFVHKIRSTSPSARRTAKQREASKEKLLSQRALLMEECRTERTQLQKNGATRARDLTHASTHMACPATTRFEPHRARRVVPDTP